MEVTKLEVAVSGTGIAKTAAELAALDAEARKTGDSSVSMGRAVSGTGVALDALTAQSQKTRTSVRGLNTDYGGLSSRLRLTSSAMSDLTARLTQQHAVSLRAINIPIRVNNGPIAGSGDAIAAGITAELDKAVHKVEQDVSRRPGGLLGGIGRMLDFSSNIMSGRFTGRHGAGGGLAPEARLLSSFGIPAIGAQALGVSLPIIISIGAALFEAAAGFTALGLAVAPTAVALGQGAMAVDQANAKLAAAIPGTAAYAKAAAGIGTAWASIDPQLQGTVQNILGLFGNQSPMMRQVQNWFTNLVDNFTKWFGAKAGGVSMFEPLLLAMEREVNHIMALIEGPHGGGFSKFISDIAKSVGPAINGLGQLVWQILRVFQAIGAAGAGGEGLKLLVDVVKTLANLLSAPMFAGFIKGWVGFDRILLGGADAIIRALDFVTNKFHSLKILGPIAGTVISAFTAMAAAAWAFRKAMDIASLVPGLGGLKGRTFTSFLRKNAVSSVVEGAAGQAVGQTAVDALKASFSKDIAVTVDKAGAETISKAMADALSMGGGMGVAGGLKGLLGRARGLLPAALPSLGELALPAGAIAAIGASIGYVIDRWMTNKLPTATQAGNLRYQYQQFNQTPAGQRLLAGLPERPGARRLSRAISVTSGFDAGQYASAFAAYEAAQKKLRSVTLTGAAAQRQYQSALTHVIPVTKNMSDATKALITAQENVASVIQSMNTGFAAFTPTVVTAGQAIRNSMRDTTAAAKLAHAANLEFAKGILPKPLITQLASQAPNILEGIANGTIKNYKSFIVQFDRQQIAFSHGATKNSVAFVTNIKNALRSQDPMMREAGIQMAKAYGLPWRSIVDNANKGVGRLADETAKRLTQMDITAKEKMRILHADFHNGYKNIADISAPAWKRIDDISVRGWNAIIKDVQKGSTTAVNTMLTNLGKTPAQSLKVWEQVARDVNTGLIPANNNMKSMINRIVGAAKSGLLPLPGAGKAAIDKFNTYLRAIGAKGAIGTFKGDWAAFIAWLRAHPATPLIKQPVLPVIPGVSPMFVNQAYRTRQHSQFGGTVFAHMPTWVGEAGREIFVPGQTGTIIPHDKAMAMTSGGETNYNMNFSAMNVRTSDVLNAVRILEMRGGGRTV